MIFLDESGDDGSKESSSQNFFVVSLVADDIKKLKYDYLYIKKKLGVIKEDFKWNSLNKRQKEMFFEIIKNLNHRVNINYVDKSKFNNFDKMYFNLVIKAFSKLEGQKTIIYTGPHLNKMFEKVRRYFKSRNLKLSFFGAEEDLVYGVAIADLWAGYINYLLRNNEPLPNITNVNIEEY